MSRNNSNTTTILMLTEKIGSPDGLQVKTYEEGKTYKLPSSLASVFIREKWAKIHTGEVSEDEDTKVDVGSATGFAYLPEGALTREVLAKDELNNKELIQYAEEFLQIEEGTIAHNVKHTDLLQDVINWQAKLEVELAEENPGDGE